MWGFTLWPLVGAEIGKKLTASSRQAAMLLARRPEKLKPDEMQLLAKLNECCPEIPILYDLTQGFATVFRGKQSDTLQTWLDQARGTGLRLPEIGRFCDGLLRDAKAVNAAVVLPLEQRSGGRPNSWAETGEATNVTARAKFNLLRRRVLPLCRRCSHPLAPRCPLDLYGSCGRTNFSRAAESTIGSKE